MRAKDKFLKKQSNLLFILISILTICFSQNSTGEEINSKIEKYIKNLNFFSSKFIQVSGSEVEEGYIYIKDKKIRLDYFSPERTLKISEKKGVYINHELREEEFFSTEKNIIKIFYDVFLDSNFFSSLIYEKKQEEIVFKKLIEIDTTTTHLKIFFENSPLVLRKIIAETEGEIISISFNEHKYNNIFNKDFFSFVPIYLD